MLNDLHLPQAIYDQLLDAAQASAEEICGVLGGQRDRAECIIPIPNVSPAPHLSYVMDAPSMVTAIMHCRAKGWDVLALYHSHPREAPIPSATDLAQATWRDAAYLIMGVESGRFTLRAWQIVNGAADEIRAVVIPN